VEDDRLDVVLAALDGPGPVAVVPHRRPLPAGLPSVLSRAPERTWLVAFTSGSTARPRAVCRTRASWSASVDALARLTGTGEGTRVLVPGPLASTLFLHAAWHAGQVGAVPLVDRIDTSLPWDVVHLVPHQLAALLDLAGDGPAADLGGRTAVVAGAALPRSTVTRAQARGLRLVAYYGAAELSFVAAGDPGDDPDAALAPFPQVQVDVRDGEVWVRSPLTCTGYLPLPEAGRADGPLRHAGGWATVGDRGAWTRDGRLRVLGRGEAVVQSGGATVLVADVETALRAVPGVRDVAVLAVPHPRLGAVVGAVVEAPSGSALDVAALRTAAAGLLSAEHRPRHWRVVPEMPRTDAGKIDRQAAAAMLPGRPAGTAGP
jgi:acyl-CoA synthetase (AMP-forming)/AMP-acid ligase II